MASFLRLKCICSNNFAQINNKLVGLQPILKLRTRSNKFLLETNGFTCQCGRKIDIYTHLRSYSINNSASASAVTSSALSSKFSGLHNDSFRYWQKNKSLIPSTKYLTAARHFSSEASSGGGDNDGKDDDEGDDGNYSAVPDPNEPPLTVHSITPRSNPMTAVKANSVPDVFPKIPVIAITRNPVFPKFHKMLEVSDKLLVDNLRRKVNLKLPYAGIFLKKDESNENEVVKSLDEIYQVGTFVKIEEMVDQGDKLRLLVSGHRRIKIVGLLSEDYEEIPTPEVTVRKKWRRRNGRKNDVKSSFVEEDIPKETNTNVVKDEESELLSKIENVLMVEVENFNHDEYIKNDEIKAMTSEMVQTIRDIIALNPIYREMLHHVLHAGQKVSDDAIYMSDLSEYNCDCRLPRVHFLLSCQQHNRKVCSDAEIENFLESVHFRIISLLLRQNAFKVHLRA